MIHRMEIRVYYEDTDLAGVVYYANYLKFLERGRTEALRMLGVDQSRLKAEAGLVFVVTRVEIDYRRPALFDDQVTVETALARRGAARIVMDQRVLRGAALLAEARVSLACMTAEGRPTRLPPEIGEALDRFAADR
ncbi:tol-pal system-associated acyl-CoA thioesterase [Paralimibaculum aggregatum]|uniref:Tol-pal system-associated acyl-CoA thioesterase n=1 Tax=Paralimibaculum aggregatum TaxID=3036245 RepID=A0ABQ6LQY9_9RHOB|nr:tol-pal system-associated acyl-CoA thioesterase [Limibaculum sp. NKW23]GMG83346.1 tol-pal system-associated acyl-CoA thioesterase [Limibaculum sp. NKW23]